MMDAGNGGGFGDIHLEFEHVQNLLEHHGDDGASARAAGNEKGCAVLQHDGGRHGRQRALAGRDRVSLAADKSEGVGRAGLGREVVHFVVEQKTRSVHGVSAAEGQD